MTELKKDEPTVEDLLKMLILQQMRIYDLLLLNLPEEVDSAMILELHRKFETMCPLLWKNTDE